MAGRDKPGVYIQYIFLFNMFYNKYVNKCVSFFAVSFRNAYTSMCLESNTKGEVLANNCNSGPNQMWETDGQSLRNKGTQQCLELSSDGGEVFTATCDDRKLSQNWNTGYQQIENFGRDRCLDPGPYPMPCDRSSLSLLIWKQI